MGTTYIILLNLPEVIHYSLPVAVGRAYGQNIWEYVEGVEASDMVPVILTLLLSRHG